MRCRASLNRAIAILQCVPARWALARNRPILATVALVLAAVGPASAQGLTGGRYSLGADLHSAAGQAATTAHFDHELYGRAKGVLWSLDTSGYVSAGSWWLSRTELTLTRAPWQIALGDATIRLAQWGQPELYLRGVRASYLKENGRYEAFWGSSRFLGGGGTSGRVYGVRAMRGTDDGNHVSAYLMRQAPSWATGIASSVSLVADIRRASHRSELQASLGRSWGGAAPPGVPAPNWVWNLLMRYHPAGGLDLQAGWDRLGPAFLRPALSWVGSLNGGSQLPPGYNLPAVLLSTGSDYRYASLTVPVVRGLALYGSATNSRVLGSPGVVGPPTTSRSVGVRVNGGGSSLAITRQFTSTEAGSWLYGSSAGGGSSGTWVLLSAIRGPWDLSASWQNTAYRSTGPVPSMRQTYAYWTLQHRNGPFAAWLAGTYNASTQEGVRSAQWGMGPGVTVDLVPRKLSLNAQVQMLRGDGAGANAWAGLRVLTGPGYLDLRLASNTGRTSARTFSVQWTRSFGGPPVAPSGQAGGVLVSAMVLPATPSRLEVVGTVFVDKNGNGVRDPDEPTVPGAPVRVGGLLVRTDANGEYQASLMATPGLAVGLDQRSLPIQYTVPPGFDAVPVRVGGGARVQIDLPVRVMGSVRGRVFVDENRNGKPDPGEQGLSGVVLTMGDVARGAWQDGRYAFDGLPPGTVTVRLDPSSLPPGYELTTPAEQTATIPPDGGVVGNVDFGVWMRPRQRVEATAVGAPAIAAEFEPSSLAPGAGTDLVVSVSKPTSAVSLSMPGLPEVPLRYDDANSRWVARVVAPLGAAAGSLRGEVTVTTPDGKSYKQAVALTVDPSRAAFQVLVTPQPALPGQVVVISLAPEFQVEGVTGKMDDGRALSFRKQGDSTEWRAYLQVPPDRKPGRYEGRVTVRSNAGPEVMQTFVVSVRPAPSGGR